jgi:hypothetical protein
MGGPDADQGAACLGMSRIRTKRGRPVKGGAWSGTVAMQFRAAFVSCSGWQWGGCGGWMG